MGDGLGGGGILGSVTFSEEKDVIGASLCAMIPSLGLAAGVAAIYPLCS